MGKLMPFLCLGIFFFDVSIGMPNPLETMIVEDRGCSLSQGTVCGGYRVTQRDCCKPGLSCQSNGYRGICEPIKKKKEECICIPTFLHKGYGNCKTDYQGKGPICYVSKEAAKYCSDAKKTPMNTDMKKPEGSGTKKRKKNKKNKKIIL